MTPLPIAYLHLETGVLLLFLAMMLWTQLQRSSGPYTQFGRKQATFLISCFAAMLVVFAALLYNVSPLLALELAAGLTLALMHPVNALCLFVVMLYLRPWEIAVENALLSALPRLLAVFCFFSWLIHPSLHARPSRRVYGALALFLGFSAWSMLSTFVTPNAAEAQADWFNSYFKAVVVLLMCLYFLEDQRSVKEFENTMIFGSLGLMAVALYRYYTLGAVAGRLESLGMLGNANDLAAVVVMAVPFAMTSAYPKVRNLFEQAAGALFTACSVLVVWYTLSRGAILALIVQVFTSRVAKVRLRRRIGLIMIAVLLCVGGSLLFRAIPRESDEMAASEQSRIIYWKAAVNMALHRPLFGVGYGEYPSNYDAYSSGPKVEWGARTAHSSWFLALGESGVPGASFLVLFFYVALITAWRNRARWTGQLYSMTGYMAAMSFLSHTYLLYPYLLAGLVLATDSLRETNAIDS